MDKHTIHVLFLEPINDDHIINSSTAFLGTRIHGKGFCHVEISLPYSDSVGNSYLSTSIYSGECVSVNKSKTFANPGYSVLSIGVNETQLNRLKEKIQENYTAQTAFDRIGMYLATLPIQLLPTRLRKTFCSKYITTLLQHADVACVRGLNPSITTPSKLYKVIRQSVQGSTLLGTVDYKRNALLRPI
jgi:hypothetical protein